MVFIPVNTHPKYEKGDIVRYKGLLFQHYQWESRGGRQIPVGLPQNVVLYKNALCKVVGFQKHPFIKMPKLVIRMCGGRRLELVVRTREVSLYAKKKA